MPDYIIKSDAKQTSTLGKVKVMIEQVVGQPSQEAINTAVAQYISEHPGSLAPLSPAVKSALLQIAEKVVYVDEHGEDYYDALDAALNAKALLQITAVFTQGSAVIYDTDTLDSLKQYLVVTAYYDDGTTADVTSACTLSGTLAEGTSTITATYSGKSATFNVTVSVFTHPYTLNYPFGDIELTDGYINDSGVIASPVASDKLYDELIPAVGFCLVTSSGTVYSTGNNQSLRIAEYDSSEDFIARSFVAKTNVIIGGNTPSYIKMGFSNGDTVLAGAERFVALNKLDTSICTIPNSTIDSSGNVAEMTGTSVSDFLPIENSGYVVGYSTEDSYTIVVAFYDASHNMLERKTVVPPSRGSLISAFAIPTNAKYVRFRCPTTQTNGTYASYLMR